MSTRGFTIVDVVVVACVMAIVAAAGFVWWQGNPNISSSSAKQSSQSALLNPDFSEWKIYTNDRKKYSFKYPPYWTLTEEKNMDYDVIYVKNQDGKTLMEIDTVLSVDCRFDSGEFVTREYT